MLLAEAGCVFMAFILYISGVQGQENSICALKGSSVDLPCSAERPTSGNKWYTVERGDHRYIQKEVSLDGNRVSHKTEDSHPTLTINDLRASDANFYCCRETPNNTESCWRHNTELHVADLQVKVIPTTEGQTVTLICNTSCPLTENPAVYIWYKNREFLYQDWSPWYHQLVSSEEAVTYSCAIKGYEHLRAPEVSVDSVTSTCFTVTYAEGRMCSDRQTPCSITYPREVQVQGNSTTLTCTTSCPVTDPKPAYRWYQNRQILSVSQQLTVIGSAESISCAVNGLEDLLSAEVCFENSNCFSVNYVRRRICALQGSSVNITSEYTHPHNQQPTSKSWFKINKNGKEKPVELAEAAPHVKFDDNMKNQHILRINNLEKDDSAEYTFRLKRPNGGWKESDFSGVTLVVTGLRVRVHPAEVTEGQNVTLSCITSCPLPHNTTYIWYLNSRPLTEPRKHNKTLILHSVSSQHAGSYSCAVEGGITSGEKTLTVQNVTQKQTPAAAAAAATVTRVCIVLLVTILLVVIFLWIRKKRISGQSPETQAMDNTEQLNRGHVYEDISTQPAEQDEFHYSIVQFSKTQPETLYCTVQPHQPKQQ
ncbi:contactin-1-like isoform X10 [Epinephelus fuscoguttatus]|uniref:contactin-1-like isoform X10 n=1 Tax=Epinephelus fuscoguttatus TaxID=293821 RepID=UPI0020D130F1|nr:contactin-1-like isoform X10 [Epinephelus fuscoguttatus]